MPVLPDEGSIRVAPGTSSPLRLGVVDHRERNPVLHRAAGVLALELGEDTHVRVRAQRGDVDERRVADQVQDARNDGHGRLDRAAA